jgi:ribosomal protein S1
VVKEENADSPIRLADLKPSMKLEGRVKKIELFGAFVDVGAERDGMIHISMLQKGHVARVDEIVDVGQEVEVWVHKVDPNAGRLELTMIRPVELKWKEIKTGIQLKGKVVRLEDFGAFIDIGAARPGLVHVSELSSDYVTNPSDVVRVGDEVEVRVVELDRRKRQIRLSMKEMLPEIADMEEESEEVPTAMEVALRQALDQSMPDGSASSEKKHHQDKKTKKELDDILSRTLKHRVKSSSSE